MVSRSLLLFPAALGLALLVYGTAFPLGEALSRPTIPLWCVLENKETSRIWAYTFTWNEEDLLPFYIHHYTAIAERVVIYDGNSTDNTLKLAKQCPKVVVRGLDTQNKLDDGVKTFVMNNSWKEARGRADYVVIGDVDEFVYWPEGKMRSFLHRNANATLFRSFSWTMVNLCPQGALNVDRPILDQVKFGARLPGRDGTKYDKVLFFSPNIGEINYKVGGHHNQPMSGLKPVVWSNERLLLLHQKFPFGLEHAQQRAAALATHLSEQNIKARWGIHLRRSSFLDQQWNMTLANLARVLP